MTLPEILEWVEIESAKPGVSVTYTKVCDELTLMRTLEKSLHHHSIEEQLKWNCQQLLLRVLGSNGLSFLYSQFSNPKEAEEKVWSLVTEENKKKLMLYMENKVKEAQKTMPEVKEAWDWENERFYCVFDMEVKKRITGCIEYMHQLIANG